MTTQNGYKMSIQNETSNVHHDDFVYTKLTSKCTKFSFNVHTFDILVYKMGTKFGQKSTVPSKIWIQNDYTKWIQNDNTKLHHLVYKMGRISRLICTKCTYKMYIQNVHTKCTYKIYIQCTYF